MSEPTTLFGKIAVATDFGASAAHAVTLASAVAARCKSELTIVHVVEPSPLGPDPAILKEAGQRALDAALVRVRDDIPTARGVLLVGHAAEEMVSFTEKNAIDLVVNGTHGAKKLERWLLGSVAQKIVRSCPTVLTVHDAARAFGRILVATDFGPASERAVELAAHMANVYSARLTLLHVVDDFVPVYSVDSLETSALAPPANELEQAVRTQLEEAAQRVSALVAAPELVVKRGKAWSEIAAEAETGAYDLVVVGTHGRKAPARWVLGSVAEKVVRSVAPPVLTVRSAG